MLRKKAKKKPAEDKYMTIAQMVLDDEAVRLVLQNCPEIVSLWNNANNLTNYKGNVSRLATINIFDKDGKDITSKVTLQATLAAQAKQ